MPNAAIVVCMDASDSMKTYSYFQPAQTDAATFVNIMQAGDSLGVTAFSDNAWIAYPSSSASVALVRSQNDLNSATTAIMALMTVSMTNMSAALSTSAGMLTNAASGDHAADCIRHRWNIPSGSHPVRPFRYLQ
jgi:Mg-chelatase subunit ChlD